MDSLSRGPNKTKNTEENEDTEIFTIQFLSHLNKHKGSLIENMMGDSSKMMRKRKHPKMTFMVLGKIL